MENHDIEEPGRSPQYPPSPCPGCGALELADCQCPKHLEQFEWHFLAPKGWTVLSRWGDGFALREDGGGLRVFVDCEFKTDGNPWLHVSYSRKDWVPSHADTCKVKAAFVGDRYAYAVFPPQLAYVNIYEHCLHLWARMDTENGRVLPEFSAEVEGVGEKYMTQTRETFLQERMTGVGGSDVAAIFNLGYGCRLRLWREKRGEVPDFPKVASGPMDLGNLLEPYFRSWYAKITGRAGICAGIQRHPDYPELFVHPDGLIEAPERPGLGVLEIKSMGRGAYYNAKRKGLPEDYVLQIQDAMLVMGLKWGSFAIGCRDFGVSRPEDLLWWDVERDDAVCDEILRAVPIFWAQVENGPMPERLEPDDRRCQDCAYRTSCQGDALIRVPQGSEYVQDETLAPLVAEYVERRDLAKEAKSLLEETKAELEAKLGDRGMVTAMGAKIQYYEFTKKQYVVPEHKERPLRVYPAKERK